MLAVQVVDRLRYERRVVELEPRSQDGDLLFGRVGNIAAEVLKSGTGGSLPLPLAGLAAFGGASGSGVVGGATGIAATAAIGVADSGFIAFRKSAAFIRLAIRQLPSLCAFVHLC